ncbi:winged helix-turn-helix domain-containing protein, partial [Chloroflexota bacterium]
MSEASGKPLELSLDAARRLAVYKQGLHKRPAAPNKQALLHAIRRISLLQLDTIHVVARSHYLVMLSRVGLYDPADLDALLYPDRRLFEQWAHAACLLPVEDYARLAPAILARRERSIQPWVAGQLGDDADGTIEAVLAEVRERGPLASRDFDDPRSQRGTWWDWKPAKTALEVLFEQGHLMVDRRVNFQRYYDLAERVLPATAEPPSYTLEDWRRWAVMRGLTCLGVATARQVSDYYRLKVTDTRATISALAKEGSVVPVRVEGWKDTAYLLDADLRLAKEIRGGAFESEVTTFLSPFDNLIWDRERVRNLFAFDYRTEMYQPAAKRRYGYYVLPILHRGRLVGRLDPKANRKAGTMLVRAIYLEPGEEPGQEPG